MDVYCDVVNQRFVPSFLRNGDAAIVLTQNDDQPIRLFMVQPSRHAGSRWPFYYTTQSGDEDIACVISLRDVTTNPLTLASTTTTPIVNGFDGVLHLNTQEVSSFLSGRPHRDADFCVDLVDGSGNRISPFRRSITLRGTDSGSVTPIPGTIYDASIIGLTGGGATNLDGIATVSRAIGTRAIVIRVISGARSESVWQLIAGTTAEDEEGGIVRPDDYASTTNEKIWVRVSGL